MRSLPKASRPELGRGGHRPQGQRPLLLSAPPGAGECTVMVDQTVASCQPLGGAGSQPVFVASAKPVPSPWWFPGVTRIPHLALPGRMLSTFMSEETTDHSACPAAVTPSSGSPSIPLGELPPTVLGLLEITGTGLGMGVSEPNLGGFAEGRHWLWGLPDWWNPRLKFWDLLCHLLERLCLTAGPTLGRAE